jgi:hypothetical protein
MGAEKVRIPGKTVEQQQKRRWKAKLGVEVRKVGTRNNKPRPSGTFSCMSM